MPSRSDNVTSEADVIVRLPDEHRAAFKDPLGRLYTDATTLLADANGPLITIGDVVSYHFECANHSPAVAVIDGRTQRSAVDPEIEAVLDRSEAERIHATNPPGTITGSLLAALREAIGRPGPVQVVVDGEEDLAAVPAILLGPAGTGVVYGQPDEGMVYVRTDAETRERARRLLALMEGDKDRLHAVLDA